MTPRTEKLLWPVVKWGGLALLALYGVIWSAVLAVVAGTAVFCEVGRLLYNEWKWRKQR